MVGRKRWMPFVLVALCWSILPSSASAAPPTYWQDIRPILRKHCTACHSAKNLAEPDVSGGLALDSFEAVVKSPKQRLVKLITTDNADRRMPQGAPPLPADKITLIRQWIDAGTPEGRRAEEVTTAVARPARRRAKLDVALPTTAVPPKGLLGPANPGNLELVLKVGPLAPVDAVTFSPDGKLLASGSYGLVTIWDVQTGAAVKTLTNVLGAVNDLRFSPDGALLAVAGGQPSAKGDLRLFHVGDWKLLATLAGHQDVVFSVAFRPDGKKLASASFDKTVRVWDVATHKTIQTLTGHSDFVYSVAFSPDGRSIASASKDRSVKLVDAATGKSRLTLSGMDQDVLTVAFSPDGKNIFSAGFDSGIYRWNAETGERIRVQGGHSIAVHELAFSKDGKLLASAGGDRTVRLWNGANGAGERTLSVGSVVYAVALHPDGKRVASGSADGLVRVWDGATGRQLLTLLSAAADGAGPRWLALTPEGFLSGSSELTALARWRMAGKAVPSEVVLQSLRQPEAVARAFRGEKPAAPPFKK